MTYTHTDKSLRIRSRCGSRHVVCLHMCVAAALFTRPAGAQLSDFEFSGPTIIEFPTENFPTNIGVADLDEDGNLDVVVTGRDTKGFVYVLMGNGDGTFDPPVGLFIDAHSDWVEIADLDGNGTLDLAIAVRNGIGGVAVFSGNGDGTFPEEFDFYRTGRTTWGVVARDFDGDGVLDLAAANNGSGSVVILINDGAGSFTTGSSQRLARFTTSSAAPSQFGAADFDGDGDQDLAVSVFSAGRVGILLNNGDATFEPEVSHGPQDGSTHLAVGDIDNDGDIDTIIALITDEDGLVLSKLAVLLGNGDGTFGARQLFDTSVGGFPFYPAIGDLDRDGDLDVAIGTGLTGRIWVMENDLADELQFLFPLELATASFFRHIALADIDNDCDLDLLAIESPSDSLYVFLNETPQADGCSGVAPAGKDNKANQPSARDTPADQPLTELVADLNGDGVVNAIDIAIHLAEWGPDE